MNWIIINIIFVCCILLTLCRSEDANLYTGISERINNFTLELLYFTKTTEGEGVNLIISPLAVWTSLLVIAQGAADNTRREIYHAIRVPTSSITKGTIGTEFEALRKFVEAQSSHFEVQSLKALFIDSNTLAERDFISQAAKYGMLTIGLDVSNTEKSLSDLATLKIRFNKVKGVDFNDVTPGNVLPYNALYFRGVWAFHFDSTFTTKLPFYDNNGTKIKDIDMMYNRHKLASVNIDVLKARAIELPFGTEDKFSMIILLPDKGVSIHTAYRNFVYTSLNEVFNKLDEVKDSLEETLVVMPKLRIRTSVDLKNELNSLGIYDIFDSSKSKLPHVARLPLYAKKFIHNVEMDVTEEGVGISPGMETLIGTRVGGPNFIVDRPFVFFVIEKVTKTVIFSGIYQVPS